MKGVGSALGDLPPALKFVLVGIVLLLVIGGLVLAFVLDWVVGLVLLGGIVLVVVLLVAFLALAAMMKKGKSKPFEQELVQNTSSSAGVSDAAARARVDELSKRFLEGIQTFKRYGKDIYDLPWFMIVGEPGSGKTEVIRHSGIGFPPGLQNELQGSGGTRNMDWWFSSNAIILDTAGRLLFEEGGGRTSGEWGTLLKMLGKHRATCPINGLMLVIPADSLIRDSLEEVEEKANRIKRQLDLIQTTLDVRFPVFVLITKADLINGFREFFDELDDPQLQHQIMGWSNPNPLDTPFDPDEVYDHILTIQDRLVRRRGGLMLDPVAREGERRLDEVDALFAFPDAIEDIAGRLERYMQIMFAAGEWTTKPLFMRGMYFVSSLQEGAALDADLAEAMGLSVDELPEGQVWARDRAYFIRDLFVKKMFKERGLVTRASNTKKLKRRRRMVMATFTTVLLLVLLGFSGYAVLTLSSKMKSPRDFWVGVDRAYDNRVGGGYPRAVVGSEPGSRGEFGADGTEFRGHLGLSDYDDESTADLMEDVAAQGEKRLSVPFVFKPAAIFTSFETDIAGGERREAARLAYRRSVLEPLLRASYAKMLGGGRSSLDPRALGELVLIHRMYTDPGTWKAAPGPALRPLFDFAAPPTAEQRDQDDWEQYREAAVEKLQASFEKLSEERGWVRRAHEDANEDYWETLRAAVGLFVDRAESGALLPPTDGASGEAGAVDPMAVWTAARDFLDAEKALIDAYGGDSPARSLDAWDAHYGDLASARERLEALERQAGGSLSVDALLAGVEGRGAAYESWLGRLKAALTVEPRVSFGGGSDGEDGEDGGEDDGGAMGSAGDFLEGPAGEYKKMREALERLEASRVAGLGKAAAAIKNNRDELETLLRSGEDGFAGRGALYAGADRLLEAEREVDRFDDVARWVRLIDAAFDREIEDDREVRRDRVRDARTIAGAGACIGVLEAGRPIRKGELYRDPNADLDIPENYADVRAAVTELVRGGREAGVEPLADPGLPFLEAMERGAGVFDDGYHPWAARAVLEAMAGVEGRGTESAREAYVDGYVRYWSGPVTESARWVELRLVPEGTPEADRWRAASEALRRLVQGEVQDGVTRLLDTQIGAFEAIEGADDWGRTPSGLIADGKDKVVGRHRFVTSEDYRRAVGVWLAAWRGLSGTAMEARGELLSTPTAEFEQQFVHLCDTSVRGASPVDFWDRLTVGLMRALRDSTSGVASAARRDALDRAGVFPLSPLSSGAVLGALDTGGAGANRVLSPRGVRDTVRDVETALPASGGDDDGSLGADGFSGNAAIGGLVRDLSGSDDRRAEERLRRLGAFASTMSGVDEVTVRVINGNAGAGATPVASNYEYVSVSQGASQSGKQSLFVGRPDFGAFAVGSGETLTITFSDPTAQGSTGVHSVSVSGPWGWLAVLSKYGGESSDGGTTWAVEVRESWDGRAYSWWVELAFNTSLGFDDTDDWAQAGGASP